MAGFFGRWRRFFSGPRPLSFRYERFGGIVQLSWPRALVFVDRARARHLGYHAPPPGRWEGPAGDADDFLQEPLSAPLEAHLQLTNRCEVGCQGCYTGATPQGAPREWGLAEWTRAIDEMATAGVFHLALGGGESAPLPWLGDLLRHARSRGLWPNLTTSGIYADEVLERLCGYAQEGLLGQINVSVDGLADGYRAARGVDGFAQAERALRRLPVLTRADQEQVADLLRLCAAEIMAHHQAVTQTATPTSQALRSEAPGLLIGTSAVLLRLRREELVGRPVAELFPEEAAKVALAGVAGGGVKHRVQWEVERKSEGGSSCITRVSLKPARKGDSFMAFALVEDVTQQRVADKSRNALIAQASHELRTPLTNIRLYAEALLEDQGENPSARATAINVINQESRRLERIVADMLSVSEIEAGCFRLRRDDIPLPAILEDLRNDFAPQAQDKEIRLVFDVAPKLPALTGDRDKVTLALHNLVGNAIKYTPAGGTVTVKAAPENPGTPAETLVVEVVDTGIGIKPEEQEQIFERFFRSADKRIASITGTGLGLTLSREVARLHGGDVTLKSKLNEGSTFTFRIPASAETTGIKQAA